MFRLHFTSGDLANTRIVATYGPYAEALFSVGVLGDRRRAAALYGGWRDQALGTTNGWTEPLRQLMSPEPLLDLFTLVGRVSSAEEGAEALLRLGRSRLRAEVTAAGHLVAAAGGGAGLPTWVFRLADDREMRSMFSAKVHACTASSIVPHWASIQAHLLAEAARMGRVLADDGITGLLNSLHPNLRWQDGVLEVRERIHTTELVTSQVFKPDQVASSNVYLNGKGLALVPSVFCRRITPYVSVADDDGPTVLFYPALRDVTDAHRLWSHRHPGRSRAALVALLGRTRATALETLAHPGTTTELAARLQVSLATASHHAGVLREAGLITTQRHGSAVLHAVSPLGVALLNGGARVDEPHDAGPPVGGPHDAGPPVGGQGRPTGWSSPTAPPARTLGA